MRRRRPPAFFSVGPPAEIETTFVRAERGRYRLVIFGGEFRWMIVNRGRWRRFLRWLTGKRP